REQAIMIAQPIEVNTTISMAKIDGGCGISAIRLVVTISIRFETVALALGGSCGCLKNCWRLTETATISSPARVAPTPAVAMKKLAHPSIANPPGDRAAVRRTVRQRRARSGSAERCGCAADS